MNHANSLEILIDISSDQFRSTIPYWVIKSFLPEYSSLFRKTILDGEDSIDPFSIDKTLNFGFSSITFGSVHAVLSCDLFEAKQKREQTLNKLINLYDLFNADMDDKILNAAKKISNKSIIKDYQKFLKSVINRDIQLQSQLKKNNLKLSNSDVDKQKAKSQNKQIDALRKKTDTPPKKQTITINGMFDAIDTQDAAHPVFTLSDHFQGAKINGEISSEIIHKLSALDLVVGSKYYKCLLEQSITRQTAFREETIEYLLLGVEENGINM